MTGLKVLLKLHHDPHPWDDLWRAIAVEHPLRDAWWDDRNLLPLLEKVDVPVYLGCDWQNVPLRLPSTFPAFAGLTNSKDVRVAMLGEHGLAGRGKACMWKRSRGLTIGSRGWIRACWKARISAIYYLAPTAGTLPIRGRSLTLRTNRSRFEPMVR